MEKNYLPLFRKYRPQSFKDVVGQESLVKALSNAIELGRIANAYLFCGPRGTGKTSTARILAKSLNCEHGPTLEPCQKCASCVDITNATGLDVIEIDAASNRGIQDAKDLISKVQYAPINGKYKIFIIDEVHMLSNDAFNALLKTFEEPPKNVIFILATTEPHKVLETIVSRCQRFDLKRITIEDIIKRLREISDIENIKIDDDALFTIAKNVSGGLRDSLALLDQVSILGIKDTINKELIEELLGKINFDVLLDLLKNIADENIEQSIKNINEIYTKGNEPRNLAENFIEFLRNIVLVLNSTNYENISNFTTLIKDDIDKINSCNFDKNKINKILNTIIEYYKEIKVSTNPYLWMELAAIAACKLDNSAKPQVQPIIQPVTQSIAQDAVQSTTQPTQTKPEITPQAKPEIQPQSQPEVQTITQAATQPTQAQPEISQPEPQVQKPVEPASNNSAQIWQKIISSISSMPARAFYSGVAKLINTENNVLTLGFLHDNALLQAKSDSKLNQLKAAINATYPNFEVEFIKITPDTKTIEIAKPNRTPAFNQPQPAQFSPQNLQMSQPQTQNPIRQESFEEQDNDSEKEMTEREKKQYSPKVQEMIEQFNGKIIE